MYLVTLGKVTQAQGIAPIKVKPFGDTRALVVGISDYQSDKIPKLSFAHRDAAVFAQLLEKETAWKVPAEDIILLTNERATRAKFINELQAIIEKCQPNDRLILYFSGHGDVEKVSEEPMGYLLFYDATPNAYGLGGACMVNTLDKYLRELILEKKVQVLFISDACRSGALAGSNIGGPEATAAAMSVMFNNAIKILSCEPNQFSVEGPWGGGRGLFSYYLVNGLKGMANTNADLYVDLDELQEYLKDSVRSASNRRQIPVFSGGLSSTKLTRIDPNLIESAAVAAAPVPTPEPPAEDRPATDALVQFQAALARKHLLFPEEGSAYRYYESMPNTPVGKAFKEVMKSALATALQGEAEQALLEYVKFPERELARRWTNSEIYKNYPAYLSKAAELQGPTNPFQDDVLSRSYYFQGVNLRLAADEAKTGRDSLLQLALRAQETALQLQPNAPHIYNEMGLVYRRLRKKEQELSNFKIAVNLSPTWSLALTNLAYAYQRMQDYEQAEALYQKTIALDDDLAMSHQNLATLYMDTEKYDLAIQEFQATIARDPVFANAYYNLGYIYGVSLENKDFEAAAGALTKYVQLRPNDVYGYDLLGYCYLESGDLDQAEMAFKTALTIDSSSFYTYDNLGDLYLRKNRLDLAQIMCEKAIQLDAAQPNPYFTLASIFAAKGQSATAMAYLQQSLEAGYDKYDEIMGSSHLQGLQSQEAFRALMHEYFPGRK